MADPQARSAALMTKLREHQCRMTPQRVALVHLLASSEDHPSAQQLYDRLRAQFPTMGLATVYKTLALLDEKDTGLTSRQLYTYVSTAWNDCNGNGVFDLGVDTESAPSNQASATAQ